MVVSWHLNPGLSKPHLVFVLASLSFLFSEKRVNRGTGLEVSHPSGPLCSRFQCVFPVLPQCLSPETPLPSVLLTAGLLSLLVDHEKLAPQLCSHSGKAGQGAGVWTPAG